MRSTPFNRKFEFARRSARAIFWRSWPRSIAEEIGLLSRLTGYSPWIERSKSARKLQKRTTPPHSAHERLMARTVPFGGSVLI